MQSDKLDKDTLDVLDEGVKLEVLINSEGWALVKNKLITKVTDLLDVSNFDVENPEQLALEFKARKMAAQIIYDWLFLDVEGEENKIKNNTDAIKEVQRGILRTRLDK